MAPILMMCLTCLLCLCHLAPVPTASVVLEPLGRFDGGLGAGAAEIVAFHAGSDRLFVVNAASSSIDILDLADPTKPTLRRRVDVSSLGTPNSVATTNDGVAVALAADAVDAPGQVAFFDLDGEAVGSATVGVLPDMVAFTPNGRMLVVANEGEPSDDYETDPEGSISLVDLTSDPPTVTHLGFEAWNHGGPRADALPDGVRIFGPGATVAQDLEPEFVAISPDGATAWVSLQENNALAVVDLLERRIDRIVSLGIKDHSLPENVFDASDRDGAIRVESWPVHGLYQPDAITAFTVDGQGDDRQTYVISANEGDARDYGGFSEEARIGDLTLDSAVFPTRRDLQKEAHLGRLKITMVDADTDGDGDVDRLFTYGGRSFSIWRADGTLVYDSGSDFERIIAAATPDRFNGQGAIESFDSRSDDKGPEPEAIVVGRMDGHPIAFIALERVGGIMAYDVRDPASPAFVTYQPPAAGDVAPEGLVFVDVDDSPTDTPLLIVAYEASGTVTIYRVRSACPEDANEPRDDCAETLVID